MRLSRSANAVSRRHGEVSREMWQSLWPDRSIADVPIGHITNGVHIASWMAPPMQALLDRYLPRNWRREADNARVWSAIDDIPEEETRQCAAS